MLGECWLQQQAEYLLQAPGWQYHHYLLLLLLSPLLWWKNHPLLGCQCCWWCLLLRCPLLFVWCWVLLQRHRHCCCRQNWS
jgi:hypothetical protein